MTRILSLLGPGTDPRTCEHAVIQTWRYADGPEPYRGTVALWACAACRTRFAPGKQHPIPLPDPRLLGLETGE